MLGFEAHTPDPVVEPGATFHAGGIPTGEIAVQAADVPAADPLAIRGDILALQAAMEPMPQVECPLKHHFAPGMYAREIFIPAGTVVVGKIHRHAHINIIQQGLVKVVTEFGEQVYAGPHTFVSQPGTKRALVTLTDTIWTTIHTNPNDHTDPELLEREIIAPDYAAIGIENAPARAISIEVKQ